MTIMVPFLPAATAILFTPPPEKVPGSSRATPDEPISFVGACLLETRMLARAQGRSRSGVLSEMIVVCRTKPIKLREQAGVGIDLVAADRILERAEVGLPASGDTVVAFQLSRRLAVTR